MNENPSRRKLLLLGAASAGLGVLPARAVLAQTDTATAPRLDVPYVPTPQEVVDRMLALAKVGKNDVLYDLGCGDGRIVVTAAKQLGARGTGIDIDPVRIAEAQDNARKAGVDKRVSFKVGDLFQADLSDASVVTLYLLPTINTRLRPRLWQQLKVGSRVVSHAFDMGPEWPPEKTASVEGRTIYYWTITEAQKKKAKA
ncbi:class I SAM-dependent methyltransferase [Massilia sp. IC2-278]|uniref:SAM-dependent methyltransferase n=1 Tax=Massilia sp. IC2-278 TaxID=2887200 RepID=UPI001E2E5D0A|nr:class I SAM-dependent methyltransferase [Massilia sp. IC2-278]MCC2959737.1 class I SAM-dependent methyltransferase [Massilia sp. IC2-278]